MFCKDCGKEMKDGTTLCPECGTKTESSNVKPVSYTHLTLPTT